MLDLMIASLLLPVSHFGLSSTRVRDLLVHRLTEQRFLAVYKSITVATLVWLGIAYEHAPLYRLWTPLYATKLIVSAVVLAAFFLIVGGITTPNPTIVGSEGLFDEPDVVRGVIRVTRNSFLWGVALWASAHIAATGDVASVLMFGSIGSLGLIGAPLLDAKKARRHGEKWRQFAAQHLQPAISRDCAEPPALGHAGDWLVAHRSGCLAVRGRFVRAPFCVWCFSSPLKTSMLARRAVISGRPPSVRQLMLLNPNERPRNPEFLRQSPDKIPQVRRECGRPM